MRPRRPGAGAHARLPGADLRVVRVPRRVDTLGGRRGDAALRPRPGGRERPRPLPLPLVHLDGRPGAG
eukprot:5610317-Lingulodinium_polyedra.AAC.1